MIAGFDVSDRRSPPDSSRRLMARGSVWTAATWALTTVVSLVLAVVLVRAMTRAQYGVLVTALAAVNLVAVVTSFGLNPAVSQLASAGQVGQGDAAVAGVTVTGLRLARGIALGTVVLALAVTAGMAIAGVRVGPVLEASMVMIPVAAAMPVIAFGTGIFRVLYRPGWTLAVSAVTLTVEVVLIGVALLAGDRSAVAIAGVRSVANVVGAACVLVLIARWLRRAPASPSLPAGRLARFGAAMALTGLFTTAVSQLDVLVLGLVGTSREVGTYQPASRLVDLVVSLPALLGAYFLPTVAREAARRHDEVVGAMYHWASRWSITLCAPLLATMMICPASVLHLAFGSGFAPAVGPLRLLAVGAVIHVVLGLNGLTLDAYGMAWMVTRRILISLAVSVATCLVFVPRWGALGAAAATVSGLVVSNALCSIQLLVRFRIRPWDRSVATTVAGFALGCVAAASVGGFVHGAFARCTVVASLAGAATLVATLRGGVHQRQSLTFGEPS